MQVNNILIVIHYHTNIGYAIATLENVFYQMAKLLVENDTNIHFAYKSLNGGRPKSLPADFRNLIEFNPSDGSRENCNFIGNYISGNNIDFVLGFDFPVSKPTYKAIKKAGAKKIVSYYGASISSLTYGIKLILKQIEVILRRNKPDLYIFESEAMRQTAVNGRGINIKHTALVRLGVDTKKFQPNDESSYTHKKFNIPDNRNIIFYSGHMQKRKGVSVIVKAAVELINHRNREDVHFLLLGNKNGEEKQFDQYYKNTAAEKHITFGGYRNDISDILPSCYLGTIASTGWDSFTMSSIEMASAGLPLIVSELQGLVETIEVGKTGFLFKPGDYNALANKIEHFIDHPNIQRKFSINSRKRVLNEFSKEHQLETLTSLIKSL